MEFHRKINMNNKPEIIKKKKITPKARIFSGNFQPNYYSIKQNNYPNHVLTYNNIKYIKDTSSLEYKTENKSLIENVKAKINKKIDTTELVQNMPSSSSLVINLRPQYKVKRPMKTYTQIRNPDPTKQKEYQLQFQSLHSSQVSVPNSSFIIKSNVNSKTNSKEKNSNSSYVGQSPNVYMHNSTSNINRTNNNELEIEINPDVEESPKIRYHRTKKYSPIYTYNNTDNEEIIYNVPFTDEDSNEKINLNQYYDAYEINEGMDPVKVKVLNKRFIKRNNDIIYGNPFLYSSDEGLDNSIKFEEEQKKFVRKYTDLYDPRKNDKGLLLQKTKMTVPLHEAYFDDKIKYFSANNKLSDLIITKKKNSPEPFSLGYDDYFSGSEDKTTCQNEPKIRNLKTFNRRSFEKYTEKKTSINMHKSPEQKFKNFSLAMISSKGKNTENRIISRNMRFEKGGVVDLSPNDGRKKRYKYLIKKMNRSPGKQLVRNNPKYREKAAELIQDWWITIKEYRKKRIKSAILIQSYFRGRFVRKYLYDVIYMNYLYFGFCKKIEKFTKKKFGPYFFDCLFSKYIKRKKALKKIISNYEYQLTKIYFYKWKKIIKKNNKLNLALLYLLRIRAIKDTKIFNLKRVFNKWNYIAIIKKERSDLNDLKKLNNTNIEHKSSLKNEDEKIKINIDKIKSDYMQKIKGLLQIINGINKYIKKKIMQIANPKIKEFMKNKIRETKLKKILKIRKKKELIIIKKYFYIYYEKCFDKEIKNKKKKKKIIQEYSTYPYNNNDIDYREKIRKDIKILNKLKIELFVKKIEPFLSCNRELHNLFRNLVYFKIDKMNNILEKYEEKYNIKGKKNKKEINPHENIIYEKDYKYKKVKRRIKEDNTDEEDSSDSYEETETEKEKTNKKNKKSSLIKEKQQKTKKYIKKENQEQNEEIEENESIESKDTNKDKKNKNIKSSEKRSKKISTKKEEIDEEKSKKNKDNKNKKVKKPFEKDNEYEFDDLEQEEEISDNKKDKKNKAFKNLEVSEEEDEHTNDNMPKPKTRKKVETNTTIYKKSKIKNIPSSVEEGEEEDEKEEVENIKKITKKRKTKDNKEKKEQEQEKEKEKEINTNKKIYLKKKIINEKIIIKDNEKAMNTSSDEENETISKRNIKKNEKETFEKKRKYRKKISSTDNEPSSSEEEDHEYEYESEEESSEEKIRKLIYKNKKKRSFSLDKISEKSKEMSDYVKDNSTISYDESQKKGILLRPNSEKLTKKKIKGFMIVKGKQGLKNEENKNIKNLTGNNTIEKGEINKKYKKPKIKKEKKNQKINNFNEDEKIGKDHIKKNDIKIIDIKDKTKDNILDDKEDNQINENKDKIYQKKKKNITKVVKNNEENDSSIEEEKEDKNKNIIKDKVYKEYSINKKEIQIKEKQENKKSNEESSIEDDTQTTNITKRKKEKDKKKDENSPDGKDKKDKIKEKSKEKDNKRKNIKKQKDVEDSEPKEDIESDEDNKIIDKKNKKSIKQKEQINYKKKTKKDIGQQDQVENEESEENVENINKIDENKGIKYNKDKDQIDNNLETFNKEKYKEIIKLKKIYILKNILNIKKNQNNNKIRHYYNIWKFDKNKIISPIMRQNNDSLSKKYGAKIIYISINNLNKKILNKKLNKWRRIADNISNEDNSLKKSKNIYTLSDIIRHIVNKKYFNIFISKLAKHINPNNKVLKKIIINLIKKKTNKQKQIISNYLLKWYNVIKEESHKLEKTKNLNDILFTIFKRREKKTCGLIEYSIRKWYMKTQKLLCISKTVIIQKKFRNYISKKENNKYKAFLFNISKYKLIRTLNVIAKYNLLKTSIVNIPKYKVILKIKEKIIKTKIIKLLDKIIKNRDNKNKHKKLKYYISKWNNKINCIKNKDDKRLKILLIRIFNKKDNLNNLLQSYYSRWKRIYNLLSITDSVIKIQKNWRKKKAIDIYNKKIDGQKIIKNILKIYNKNKYISFINKLKEINKKNLLIKIEKDFSNKKNDISKYTIDKIRAYIKYKYLLKAIQITDNIKKRIIMKYFNVWKNKTNNNNKSNSYLNKIFKKKEFINKGLMLSYLLKWLYHSKFIDMKQKVILIQKKFRSFINNNAIISKWNNLKKILNENKNKKEITEIVNRLKIYKAFTIIKKNIKTYTRKNILKEFNHNNKMFLFINLMKKILLQINGNKSSILLKKYFDIWKNNINKEIEREEKLKDLLYVIEKRMIINNANNLSYVSLLRNIFNCIIKIRKLDCFQKLRGFYEKNKNINNLCESLSLAYNDFKLKKQKYLVTKILKYFIYHKLLKLFEKLEQNKEKRINTYKSILITYLKKKLEFDNRSILSDNIKRKRYSQPTNMIFERKSRIGGMNLMHKSINTSQEGRKIKLLNKNEKINKDMENDKNIIGVRKKILVEGVVNKSRNNIKKGKRNENDTVSLSNKSEENSLNDYEIIKENIKYLCITIEKVFNKIKKDSLYVFKKIIYRENIEKEKEEEKIYYIYKLYKALKKLTIKKIFTEKEEVSRANKLIHLLKLTKINLQISTDRWIRQLLRRWRFISFVKNVSKKKLELMYKNLHVGYLEIINSLFNKESQNMIKEFENFGADIGMYKNSDYYINREKELYQKVKKKYISKPIEYDKENSLYIESGKFINEFKYKSDDGEDTDYLFMDSDKDELKKQKRLRINNNYDYDK